jgi:hypothetical protein
MVRTVVLLLVLMSATARAEGPWGVALGAGPAVHRVIGGTVWPGQFMLGASARLDAGYRVIDSTAVGVAVGPHFGIAYARAREIDGVIDAEVDATYIPFEMGLGAQVVIAERLRVAAWGGMIDLRQGRFGAWGVDLGFDIVVRGQDRVSAVATCTRAEGPLGYSYDSIGAGVAYRYW